MVLTVHTLFDIPRDLVSLDPRRESVELVLKPSAKYYFENKRFSKLDLPEQYISFSPSSILFKRDRFVLDFDASLPTGTGRPLSRSGTPRRAASFGNGTQSNGTDTLSATTVSMPPTSKHAEGDARLSHPRPFQAFAETPDLDREETSSAPASSMARQVAGVTMERNQLLVRYPTRTDLKVIIEVMVGVRQRRHDSSAVRWITPSWEDRSIQGSISSFASADGEVVRHKLVNRFVGLTVGHLSCTMSLPHAEEDLRLLPNSSVAIAAATERLCDDWQRLIQMHSASTAEERKKKALVAAKDRPTRRQKIFNQLYEGETETAIYGAMLLEVAPQYYVNRIRRICATYPPTPQSSSWVHADAEKLAADYTGREMTLIRHLCAELGPDLSSISPRNRFLSYTNVQQLGEELWRWITDRFAPYENEILDYEPDIFMEALAQHYGKAEPAPIQYGFPAISYELDRRAYFCDTLRFPMNRGHQRYRDEAIEARRVRIPLQLTPHERPLFPIDPSSRHVSEIDILLEKYKPEFAQIVPSIADAMEAVTQQNEQLFRNLLAEQQKRPRSNRNGTSPSSGKDNYALPYEVCPSGFQLFQSERPSVFYVALLSRFAEYTYISPSSLLAAIIYLDRLCSRYPRLLLTSRNIEKLLVAAVRVSSKVVDLRSVNNKNIANIFGIGLSEINEMEAEFLKLMDFDFFLSPTEFNNYAHLLQMPAACTQMSSSLRLSSAALPSNPAAAAAAGAGGAEATAPHPAHPALSHAAAAAVGVGPGSASGPPVAVAQREAPSGSAAPLHSEEAAGATSGKSKYATTHRLPYDGGASSGAGGGVNVLKHGGNGSSSGGGTTTSSSNTNNNTIGAGVLLPRSSASEPTKLGKKEVSIP